MHNFGSSLRVFKEFSNLSPQSPTHCVNIKKKVETGTTFEEHIAEWCGNITGGT